METYQRWIRWKGNRREVSYKAPADAAGWETETLDRWRGRCPVTDEGCCTVEPGFAEDGVLMKCWRLECITPQGRLGRKRYREHRTALERRARPPSAFGWLIKRIVATGIAVAAAGGDGVLRLFG